MSGYLLRQCMPFTDYDINAWLFSIIHDNYTYDNYCIPTCPYHITYSTRIVLNVITLINVNSCEYDGCYLM